MTSKELVEELEKLAKVEPCIIKEGREYEIGLICQGRLQIKDRLSEILSRFRASQPQGEDRCECIGSLINWIDKEPEKVNKTMLKHKIIAILSGLHPAPAVESEPLAVLADRKGHEIPGIVHNRGGNSRCGCDHEPLQKGYGLQHTRC